MVVSTSERGKFGSFEYSRSFEVGISKERKKKKEKDKNNGALRVWVTFKMFERMTEARVNFCRIAACTEEFFKEVSITRSISRRLGCIFYNQHVNI